MSLMFTNPRLKAEFDDWPSGRDRVKCKFEVEYTPKKGYRTSRTTQKDGRWCAPKYDTYGDKTVIVDGNDGRTYILKYVATIGCISILDHNFKTDSNQGWDVWNNNKTGERYAELMAIIEAAY